MNQDASVVTTQRTSRTIKLLQLIARIVYCIGLVVALLYTMRWGIALIALGAFLTGLGRFWAWWRHG